MKSMSNDTSLHINDVKTSTVRFQQKSNAFHVTMFLNWLEGSRSYDDVACFKDGRESIAQFQNGHLRLTSGSDLVT